jgi:hypothetical protein
MFVGGKANGREADIHGVMQPVCNNHFGKENRMGFITDHIPVQGQIIKTLDPGPITRAYFNKEDYMPTDKLNVTTTMISGWDGRKVCDDLETAVPLVLEVSGTTVLIVPGVTTTKWMRKPGTPKKQQVAMLLPLYEAGIVAALRLGITVKVVPIIGFDFDRIEMDDEERSMLTFTDKKITGQHQGRQRSCPVLIGWPTRKDNFMVASVSLSEPQLIGGFGPLTATVEV